MSDALLAARFGVDSWFDYQLLAFAQWRQLLAQPAVPGPRVLVHYPTGKGKSKTMLAMLAIAGHDDAVVVAPPVTRPRWEAEAEAAGMTVTVMSHAKFRQASTKLSRSRAVIVDEFHLLGGHTGVGWKKLDRAAASITAPVILGSATPNYNDAERCYCIAHVLDPWNNRGGYVAWLYEHCETEPNPFGSTPLVKGFRRFAGAAEFLAAQPYTVYLPDDAPDILVDVPMGRPLPAEFEEYGLDKGQSRIMASQMEDRHRRRYLQVVDPESGLLHEDIYEYLITVAGNSVTPVIVFAAHAEIAKALARMLAEYHVEFGYVDGSTPAGLKDRVVEAFKAGDLDVLVGTASIATGTDGLDKVCDTLIILDDTDDDSLRRQLVGRILPRGADSDYRFKVALRFVYDS